MSNKLYRPKRKKSKEKLSFMDKLEMGSIAIATAALIGWSGWSAVDALTPDPPVPTYSLYMDGITAFLMTTQGVDPDDHEADVEQKEKMIQTQPIQKKHLKNLKSAKQKKRLTRTKQRQKTSPINRTQGQKT